MKLEVITADPLKILSSTKSLLLDSQFVNLDESGLDQISGRVEDQLKKGLETAEEGFGAKGDYHQDVQLIFLQSVVNFCFWAGKDEPKWQIEWPIRNSVGGGYGMISSFKRALAKGSPILDANFLATIGQNDVEHFFRSNNNTQIPLLKERVESLREAGQVLQQKYNGQFINALQEVDFDAIGLVSLLEQNFSSFRDVTQVDGITIPFLKRAQICANDLSYLSPDNQGKPMTNLDNLTGFADYKIAQMLEAAGVTRYSDELAQQINNYELIPAGSRQECEIRAASIWGVELIRQRLGKYTAAEIDNAIWLLSQDQTGLKPYHRTRTINY